MTIRKATAAYEDWLGRRLTLVAPDLKLKRTHMKEEFFPFLRATYYRWAQVWKETCGEAAKGPKVLAVGDLHVENFGTWRDIEGRLVWGINDFDEAWRLPYTNDLIRLTTSARISALAVEAKAAAEAILTGYREGLAAGGRPVVLAEHHTELRSMATERLHDPEAFWTKLHACPDVKERLPARAAKALAGMMPERGLSARVVHRVAGLGSLGRQRFVALAQWRGGSVAREAKALAPSANLWAEQGGGTCRPRYNDILAGAVRCRDPSVRARGRWIVRRLAPDCSRIELSELPRERDEVRLLQAMGWETANIHLGSGNAKVILKDLGARPKHWLATAARAMEKCVREDWQSWRG
jgi:hypothetical protein